MIFVLEGGGVVESGNHDELSQNGKFYASLLEAQKANHK